ncbi:MAG: PDZ domain-containing protein [Planctomycetes bacterium]|nr:PDZ domain-containing protein [Planctomycetota bacterium]
MTMMTMRSWLMSPVAGFLLCGYAAGQEPNQEKDRVIKVASLGASTRAPTKDEVEKLGLRFEVRARGQVAAEVAEGGAASKSGLVVGDVIVKLDKVDVFSQDDVADFLRVCSPGQKVEASIHRAGSKKEEVLQIVLGDQEVAAPQSARLEWQYASLAQLDSAIAKAKKDGRLVLVGLSGAET